MKWLVFILFSLGVGPLFSQTLTKQQAIEDIDYYFQTIDACHPDMYWPTPKSVVDSFISQIKILMAADSIPPALVAYWCLRLIIFLIAIRVLPGIMPP